MAESIVVGCGSAVVERETGHGALFPFRRVRSVEELPVREFQLGTMTISAIVVEGIGRPVLFLHGNSSCKEIWSHQIEAMRLRGRPVVAPDLPGHGRSSNARDPSSIYSFPGYAAVVGELLDKLNWTSVDVVGWSLGGHIGLELLATDDRVRSLAIVGTPPARPCYEALEDAFHATPKMQLTGKRDFTKSDALAYATSMLGGDAWVSRHHLDGVRRTDGDARHYMLSNALKGRGVDQRRLVESDDTRLCVMHGEKDPFVRLDYLMSLDYRNLWTDRVHIFSGAGHAPHWQYPVKFNEVICAFLSEKSIVPEAVDHTPPLSL